MYINENLTWKTCIDHLGSKLARTKGILNRLKHFLPVDVKMKISNALIASHLNYSLLLINQIRYKNVKRKQHT